MPSSPLLEFDHTHALSPHNAHLHTYTYTHIYTYLPITTGRRRPRARAALRPAGRGGTAVRGGGLRPSLQGMLMLPLCVLCVRSLYMLRCPSRPPTKYFFKNVPCLWIDRPTPNHKPTPTPDTHRRASASWTGGWPRSSRSPSTTAPQCVRCIRPPVYMCVCVLCII